MPADTREQRPVSRNTTAFLLRNRPLELGAEHCMRQGPDCRNNMRKQACECAHVVFAVGYDILLFLRAKRRPLKDAVTHFLLAHNVDFVFEEIAQRPADTEKTLFAVSALNGAVVHVMPKLNICVERAGRFAPIARNVKPKLG